MPRSASISSTIRRLSGNRKYNQTAWLITSAGTSRDVDHGSQVEPLLDQITGPTSSAMEAGQFVLS
jgi:hypothetical protein